MDGNTAQFRAYTIAQYVVLAELLRTMVTWDSQWRITIAQAIETAIRNLEETAKQEGDFEIKSLLAAAAGAAEQMHDEVFCT